MQKMTMNVLLSLIIQSKITGRGMTSNGRLYVMLIMKKTANSIN